jgi:hypothetical protein
MAVTLAGLAVRGNGQAMIFGDSQEHVTTLENHTANL